MCESLYQTMSTMTTSIDIAEKVVEESSEEIEGLDALSAYIEKVLSRVKVSLLDTVLRVESENGETKLELRIKRIEYLDETEDKDEDDGLPTVYLKKVLISGITFWHDQKSTFTTGPEAESFYESPPESPGSSPPPPPIPQGEPDDTFALIGEVMGTQEVRVQIQPREGTQSPKLSLDATLQAVTFFLCPRQIHSILDLINSLSNSTSKSSLKPAQRIRPDEFNRIEPQIFYEEQNSPEMIETFNFRPGGGTDENAQFYSLYDQNDPMTTSMTSSVASTISQASSTGTAKPMRRKVKVKENTGVGWN